MLLQARPTGTIVAQNPSAPTSSTASAISGSSLSCNQTLAAIQTRSLETVQKRLGILKAQSVNALGVTGSDQDADRTEEPRQQHAPPGAGGAPRISRRTASSFRCAENLLDGPPTGSPPPAPWGRSGEPVGSARTSLAIGVSIPLSSSCGSFYRNRMFHQTLMHPTTITGPWSRKEG